MMNFGTSASDAERYSRVIVGGDMNSRAVGYAAQDAGFDWPTESGPPTTALGRWDHVFVRGLGTRGPSGAGTVLDVEGVSDHRAIWVVVDLDPRNDLKEHPDV
jgi:endonuclease/exonuclease/phosphatase family metal-dependent hydrolase